MPGIISQIEYKDSLKNGDFIKLQGAEETLFLIIKSLVRIMLAEHEGGSTT